MHTIVVPPERKAALGQAGSALGPIVSLGTTPTLTPRMPQVYVLHASNLMGSKHGLQKRTSLLKTVMYVVRLARAVWDLRWHGGGQQRCNVCVRAHFCIGR